MKAGAIHQATCMAESGFTKVDKLVFTGGSSTAC
jgi:hypothetical protein